MTSALALLVPIIGGSLILLAFWPRERAWRADLPLILALGAGLGLGLSSVSFFVGLVGLGPTKAYFAVEVLGVAVLGVLVLRRFRTGTMAVSGGSDGGVTRAPFVSWLLVQVASVLLPAFEVGTWAMRATILLLAVAALAMISTGEDSRSDQADEGTLAQLGESGAMVLRTDLHGSVEAISDGRGYEVRVGR